MAIYRRPDNPKEAQWLARQLAKQDAAGRLPQTAEQDPARVVLRCNAKVTDGAAP